MAEVKKTLQTIIKTAKPAFKKTVAKTTVKKPATVTKAPVKKAVKAKEVKVTTSIPKETTAKVQLKAVVSTPKAVSEKKGSLKIEVMDTVGKVVETIDLPKEFFSAKVNARLMAQAVRVYLANQRLGTASTKTRGEVDGSTRKIYRQKGTGRARHGGIRAPLFVKGGVAHGPKPKDYSLTLSKPMKKAALASALTSKGQSGEIAVIAGLSKIEGKTQAMAKALGPIGYSKKGKMLLVLPAYSESLYKSVRNLSGMTVMPVGQLNTYEVLLAKKLVFMKEAVETMTR